MSRVVNYTEAADWTDEEAQENYTYLDTRGRIWELEQAKALRGEAGPGEAPPTEASGEVPDGNVDEVMAWVGGDKDRAGQALDKELESEKPRTTLIDALEALTEAE